MVKWIVDGKVDSDADSKVDGKADGRYSRQQSGWSRTSHVGGAGGAFRQKKAARR